MFVFCVIFVEEKYKRTPGGEILFFFYLPLVDPLFFSPASWILSRWMMSTGTDVLMSPGNAPYQAVSAHDATQVSLGLVLISLDRDYWGLSADHCCRRWWSLQLGDTDWCVSLWSMWRLHKDTWGVFVPMMLGWCWWRTPMLFHIALTTGFGTDLTSMPSLALDRCGDGILVRSRLKPVIEGAWNNISLEKGSR